MKMEKSDLLHFLLELYLNSFFCKMVKELSSNGDTNRVVFRVKNNL